MGRKKAVENRVILDLVQNYFVEECHGNPDELKLPRITKYINGHGYPNYAVETLRRNTEARAYVDKLKQDASQDLCVVYKTLDVETFLDTNRTKNLLTKALSELDGYYKSIADNATAVQKKYRTLMKKYEAAVAKLIVAEEENKQRSQSVKPSEDMIRELRAENQALRTLINDYVYPDIANELLVKVGVLKNGGSTIMPDKLEEHVITDISTIKTEVTQSSSNVIQGLFDVLGD